jgi:type VI protein secretion system component VasF
MKHTRGPWIASEYGDYGDYDGKCRVILGEGGDIRTAVVLGFDTEENQANARLIAAAPDLLEALQRINEACAQIPEGLEGYLEHLSDAISDARKALAKATGEQQ